MRNNESGMVLVLVILVSAALAVLATGLYFSSGSQLTRANRAIRLEQAFFIAEAGVERAKAELVNRAHIGFDNTLLGPDGIPNTVDDGELWSDEPFGGGLYSVRITNNDDDPDPFVDTDNIVIIHSTGTYQDVNRAIKVRVRVTPNLSPPMHADGAIAIYGESSEVTVGGSSLIDGRDYNLPQDFECAGAGCLGTVSANPATAGVFVESASSTVSSGGSSQILGNPPINTGAMASISEQYWIDLADQLVGRASIVLPGGVIGGNQTIGTRDAPEIALLTADTRITGNVDGAGILIVSGEVDVDLTGTFHYEGIIILLGDRSKLDDRGTASLFGTVVTIGRETVIRPRGSPQIMYSSAALANLQRLPVPPADLDVLSWREMKQ